ncbi:MAG: DUF4494 domain-containing protein [Dysgonamonadaceae bacterium]|jgi:DNA-directed RNA polymerase subunit beta|nr:DUF4494 domain-containing protein [Dysgonamonadaceae bacterium]
MEVVIKKTLPVEEANGWYLLQTVYKTWTEDFVDDKTGEVVSVERNETILHRDCKITDIDIATLKENGITSVYVSDTQIKGRKYERMNLWEASLNLTLIIAHKQCKKKKTYIVTAESPTDAEKFISDYLETNVDCAFEVLKVSKIKYNTVSKLYDTEREEYEADGNSLKWYKAQLVATTENEDGKIEVYSTKNILVQAKDFETALKAIKVTKRKNRYDVEHRHFKSIQELKVEKVFVPDKAVVFYSNNELDNEYDL